MKRWNDAAGRCARQYNVDARNFLLSEPNIFVRKRDAPLPQAPMANADAPPPAGTSSYASALMQSEVKPFVQALKQAQPLAFMTAGGKGGARRLSGSGVPGLVPRRFGKG